MELYFHEISSTNDWIKTHEKFLPTKKPSLVSAGRQTKGKGRYGKKWHSPHGNLYASFLLPSPPISVTFVSLLFALSLASYLRTLSLRVKIKWPNDILLDAKKISGILLETLSRENKSWLIVGFGLNISMSQEDFETIDQAATSLSEHLTTIPSPLELLEGIKQEFLKDIKRLETGDESALLSRYETLMAFKEEKVKIIQGNKEMIGRILGVSKEGFLLLETDTGTTSIEEGSLLPFQKHF